MRCRGSDEQIRPVSDSDRAIGHRPSASVIAIGSLPRSAQHLLDRHPSIGTPVVSITTRRAPPRAVRPRASSRSCRVRRARSRRRTSWRALRAGVRRIRGAAAGPLLRRRVEVDLHVGVGEHDRADVAPFHHHAAAFAVARAGARRARGARPDAAPRVAGGLVDLRRADRRLHVVAVDRDPARLRRRTRRARRARRWRPRRRDRRRRAAPSTRARDTSRRCRCAGSRAAPPPRARPSPSPRPTGRRSR